MSADRQIARQLQRRERLCAAAVRALTGDAGLHYRDGRLCRNLRPLPLHAPHLRPETPFDDLDAQRGGADAAALRLRYGDLDLHRSLRPEDPIQRLLFELLEQLRCESLVPAGMAGVRQNVRHRFEAWSSAFHRSGWVDSHLGILLYTATQVAWSRLTGWPVLEATEDLIEATRAAVVPILGTALAGMRRHRADQRAFAVHALAFAALIGEMIDAASDGADNGDDSDDTDQKKSALRAAFSLALGHDDDAADGIDTAATGLSRVLEDCADGYRVFTRRYDREVLPGRLVRRALLDDYRRQLDQRIGAQGINVGRLARELSLALSVPTRDGWLSGEEQGRIDGRRLAQVVCAPAERRVFQREQYQLRADSAVSFLIDCSGSMKQHVEHVAMLVDILSRALDRAGVANEILGFTTGAWNGGRPRAEWLARGRPAHPGRLNETCHMVFKDARTTWRKARTDIAALLKLDLFREGVDGEAVDWACARLRLQAQPRRTLVVISDGSPIDSATGQANDAFYLDNHLKAVVARQEMAGDVRILGLGVGLDLSPYYRHSLAVDLGTPPGMPLLQEVVSWLGARR